jgi:type I restriction enzyme S subunit
MNQIPDSWALTTVGEITLPVSTVDAGSSPDREIQYIDIGSIDNQHNKVAEPKRIGLSTAPSRARQIVKSGDVLFATVRPYLRNIAQVPDRLDGEIASTGFAVLRPALGVEPSYLYYKAISHDFVSALTGEQYGVSYPAVKDEQVRARPIELPPTNEQRRIVAKIEKLFSELDQGIESLTTARERLKAYRQSVLKAAFEGKLTDDGQTKKSAREHRNGSPLAAKIVTELRQRTSTGLSENGGRSGRTRVAIKEAEIFPDDDEIAELPIIPEDWLYVKLAALGVLARGKSRHRPRNAPELFGGPYPFIQTGEIKAAKGIIKQFSQTYSEFGLSQSKLWPVGTLCITIAANIAETAFLGFEACFPDSVVGFTPDRALVDSKYVEYFIQATRARISAYAPATAQKNINLETLEKLVIPYCSLDQQAHVVRSLDSKLEVTDLIGGEIEAGLARAEALRQSVLKRAFAGQLVSHDPTDEPASILLDRIGAKREERGATRRRNKKNGKKEAA